MKNRCTFALAIHTKGRTNARQKAGFFCPQAIKIGSEIRCRRLIPLLPFGCIANGKYRADPFCTPLKPSVMQYAEKGLEAKPSSLSLHQSQAVAQITEQYFKDFDPDTVVDHLNELHHHYMGSDDYVDVMPTHRVDLAFTLHRLSEMLHKLHRLHNAHHLLIPKIQ